MSFFEQRTFYHDGMRELQDEFDGRRVADAIERNRKHYAFWDDEREWIQSTPFFFIASAFGEHVDCSVKCGDPGFVKIVGENVIEYPEYDGSSMYRTLGNLRKNPSVGLLFVKFDGKSRRIRINGKASIHTEREWRWPERDRCHHLGSARAGSVTSALEPLRMAKKLDPCRETARMALEPWLVEAALATSIGRLVPLNSGPSYRPGARRTKVRWPEWWSARPQAR
jgi:hypothetical protein